MVVAIGRPRCLLIHRGHMREIELHRMPHDGADRHLVGVSDALDRIRHWFAGAESNPHREFRCHHFSDVFAEPYQTVNYGSHLPKYHVNRKWTTGFGELRQMQPVYVTLSSTGSSPWKIPNWQMPQQQISFAVLSTGGSSWTIDVTFEDPSGTYPSPRSSAPTPFTILTGSSNQFIGIGPGSTTGLTEIAGYRFNFNAASSAGASVTLVCNQAGIG